MRFKLAESLCTECRLCQLACSATKDGHYALKQSRIQVRSSKTNRTRILVCRQCRKCKCVEACPYSAFKKDEKTGGVSVDSGLCQACLACVEACPFGAVAVNSKNGLPMVCDLCGGHPSCMQVCGRGAIRESRSDPTA